jgi:hypothetical protein
LKTVPEEVLVSLRHTFKLLAALMVFAAGLWAMASHQKRIDQERVESERNSLPIVAESLVSNAAHATALCSAVGAPDLSNCRSLGKQSAVERLGIASAAADLALSSREYFFERCKSLETLERCEQMLRQALANGPAQARRDAQ